MKKHIIIRLVGLLVLLGLAGGVYAFGWGPWRGKLPFAPDRSTPAAAAPPRYQTVAVRAGDLTATIATSGAIRSKQSAVLVWQTSGTVENVNADAGQVVEAGTVLARLEQTSLPQAVILAEAELVNAQKALDTLLESTQARANTQLALVKAQKALDDAQDDRRNKLYQRASQETIDIARARLITANEALDQAEAFFDGHSGDPESLTYATALSQLAKARQDQTHAEYNLNYVQGLPDPLDIEEADALIAVAEANLLQAKLDWERVKDGPNEDDVRAAEARMAAAQAVLNLARLTAPFTGTITLANSEAGDQVVPGTAAFQLDDLTHLYLDVSVAEIDIARIAVGQPARVSLEALPGREYSGVVTEIGAVGKNIAGTVNFTVTVEIKDIDGEIKPGMTAAAEISVSQVSGGLLVPARAVRAQDGQAVVYLLRDGRPAPVAVRTGEISGEECVLTAGEIEVGDLVILNP